MLEKFKVQSSKFKVYNLKGFTLIELLVVITLIAILAVAVLATINPIEQRRKGTDTAMQATASEYLSAQERYYATYGCFTHDDVNGAPGTGANCNTGTVSARAAGATLANSQNLVTTGEIKQGLLTRLGQTPYSNIFFSVLATGEIKAGFIPLSKQFQAERTGSTNACTAAGVVYVCIPEV